jgi:hypothetical protein
MPMGFGANAGSLIGAAGSQSFRIDAPCFAQLEPSVKSLLMMIFDMMMMAFDACSVLRCAKQHYQLAMQQSLVRSGFCSGLMKFTLEWEAIHALKLSKANC